MSAVVKLSNQIVYVAGGCDIVGSGIARSLLANGSKVWVSSSNEKNLADFEATVPKEHRENIRLVDTDNSNLSNSVTLRKTILKTDGRVDHVVSSPGSWVMKDVLREQISDIVNNHRSDFNFSGYARKIFHVYLMVIRSVWSHYFVYKTFSKHLSTRNDAKTSYTFITGEQGDAFSWEIPELFTLGLAAATLNYCCRAAFAEHKKNPNFKLNEMRYSMYIKNRADKEYDPVKSDNEVGNDWTAKFVIKAIENHRGGQYKILNRKTGEDLYAKM